MFIREVRNKIFRALAARLRRWSSALERRLQVEEQTTSSEDDRAPEGRFEGADALGDDLSGMFSSDGPPKEWLDKVRAGAPHLLRSAQRRTVIRPELQLEKRPVDGTAEVPPGIRQRETLETGPATSPRPVGESVKRETPPRRSWPSTPPGPEVVPARSFSLKDVRTGPPPERFQPAPQSRLPEATRPTSTFSAFQNSEAAISRPPQYRAESEARPTVPPRHPVPGASTQPPERRGDSFEPPASLRTMDTESRPPTHYAENPPGQKQESKHERNAVLSQSSSIASHPDQVTPERQSLEVRIGGARGSAAEESQAAPILSPKRPGDASKVSAIRSETAYDRRTVPSESSPPANAWPELPELQEPEPREGWETELRRMQRLARLEREQRGEAWSE